MIDYPLGYEENKKPPSVQAGKATKSLGVADTQGVALEAESFVAEIPQQRQNHFIVRLALAEVVVPRVFAVSNG